MFKPLLTATIAALVFTASASAEILVKSSEKIAFMGDSITQGGWGNHVGYVRLVQAGLKANGVEAEIIPAGISGHKSNQMLERLERDALSKKPQWMTLSCGVNDVWHGAKGVALEPYKENITKIADQCAAAGVKLVILTATVIKENLDSPENEKLAPYNDFLRQLAKERKLPLADLNAMFQEQIKKAPEQKSKGILTSDGVHMNNEGNKLMAEGVLRAFGLDDTQLGKAKAAWAEIKKPEPKPAPAAPAAPAPAAPAPAK